MAVLQEILTIPSEILCHSHLNHHLQIILIMRVTASVEIAVPLTNLSNF